LKQRHGYSDGPYKCIDYFYVSFEQLFKRWLSIFVDATNTTYKHFVGHYQEWKDLCK